MTKIKLIRSGGFIGKILTAEMETDINEIEILEAIETARKIPTKGEKDSINYGISVNDSDSVSIQFEKINNRKLKVLLTNLKNKLKG